MKVIHIAEIVRGGIATVLHEHVRAQIRAFGSQNVCLVVPADQAGDLNVAEYGVSVYVYRRNGRDVLSLFRLFRAIVVTLLRERPDVVHLHSSFAGALGRCALLLVSPWKRPRVIYCPHGFSFLMDSRESTVNLLTAIERFLAKFTDVIICVSPFELRQALSHGFAANKLKMIPNGIPLPEIVVPSLPKAERGVLRLLFVGRLDYAKGFDVVIDAMWRLRGVPVKLTVVGAPLLDDLQVGDLPENVSVVGWLPKHDLARYYMESDVLVVPSRWEAFGLVVVEAASYGCPSIASRNSALEDVVHDNVTGRLFTSGSATELASIVRDTPLSVWRKLGTSAQQAAANRYSAEQMAVATIALYETVGTNAEYYAR